MSDRQMHIHMARVFLSQARAARRHSGWHATLLRWAANRRLMATQNQPEPVQAELF
ncbi:TPA: hypothetical protein QDC51_000999 [Burkholderia multivorans]|nr:hypothetical protein [Burkholderia multivorans]HDR9834247.1 hypothetical protein [Burkholderia multivorans]HDR9846719.1 hypothetical protein [Burkholderia multivorans]HDR9853129.1 hypothetical protein [Burkholderia multivorans]